MRIDNPVSSLAEAFYRALIKDLPDIEYRAWTPHLKKQGVRPEHAPLKKRRPHDDDVEVYHFPQTWGSTALGFGGLGGSMMTSAYTTVVVSEQSAAVYFAGRHAYTVPKITRRFREDIHEHNMAARSETGRYLP